MTIEAQGNVIFVRCGSGDGNVIEIERPPGDDNIGFSLWFDATSPIGAFVDERFGNSQMCDVDGTPFLSLPRAEVLALGHMLVDLARHMPSDHPQYMPGELDF